MTIRSRYETFGGILLRDRPAGTLYVDQDTMRGLGFPDSPLWGIQRSYLSAPLIVDFALTYRCPLGCRICHNNSGVERPDELTTREAKSVLDTLARIGVFTVAFTGGEPLARPDVFVLAEYARKVGLNPTLTTSGYLMDDEIARRCRVFDQINVSLDGVGETYGALRGVHAFEYTDRAIRLLRQNRISTAVNCIVSRVNIDHLDALADYMCSLGVYDILFLRLKPVGQARIDYEQARLTPGQVRGLYPRLARLTRSFGLRSQLDCAMMPWVYYHQPDLDRFSQIWGKGCKGGSEWIEISPTGKVHACSFSAGSAGDARSLPDYWHTEPHLGNFREWRERAPQACQSCHFFHLCHGGCRAVAHALTGDFFAPDPDCPVLWERKPFFGRTRVTHCDQAETGTAAKWVGSQKEQVRA